MAQGPSQPSIIVGWDGSPYAEDALELGRVLARATGARLIAAEVSVDRLAVLRRRAPDQQASTEPISLPANAPRGVEPRTVVSSSAGHGLHDLAEEVGADLIVLGSTHRGAVGRVFLGTVADDLIHGAPCAVAVAPSGYARRYANRLMNLVLVAYDASPDARVAAAAAARIAEAAAASLRVVAVLEPPPLAALAPGAETGIAQIMEDEQRRLQAEVAALIEGFPPAIAAKSQIVPGNAARTLVHETARDADLLVVGSRGYGPVGRTFLGSVSSEVVRFASCPVMVVPRDSEPA